MASCLITIGGTSGSVQINFTLAGVPNTINAGFGTTQYIEDTATAITWSTISGDATASSACVTIVHLTVGCYLYSWETIGNSNTEANSMVFDGIEFNNVLTAIPELDYTNGEGYTGLASLLTDLQDNRLKVMSGKRVMSTRSSLNNYMILQIVGSVIPMIRITDPLYSHHLYLKGTLQTDCTTPVGYTEYNNCINNFS